MPKHFEPPKAIRLPNGGRLRFGQIIGEINMERNPQRKLNSSLPM